MAWVLLVVLLSLGWHGASPTEGVVTLSALDLGTATSWLKRDPSTTLGIWAFLRAVLHVDLIESLLHDDVLLSDLTHLVREFIQQIDSVHWTPLEWMDSFLAVKTEPKLTMGAATRVRLFLNDGYCATRFVGAPTHVVHLVNCVPKAEVLVLFEDVLAKVEVVDV